MKIDQGLEEVWAWKQQLAEEYADLTTEEYLRVLCKKGEAWRKACHLDLPVRSPREPYSRSA